MQHILVVKGAAMTLRSFANTGRCILYSSRLLQIGLLLAFWLAGEIVVRYTGLPVPAGIVGMFLVLALLVSRRLSPASMRRGANWFLAEMLLFFIPAVPAVLDHREFLGWLGLKTTALTVDLCYRWMSRRV